MKPIDILIEIKDGAVQRVVSSSSNVRVVVIDHDDIDYDSDPIELDDIEIKKPDYVSDPVSDEFDYENNTRVYDVIRDQLRSKGL
jgi:hypothetical protein